MIQFKNLSHIYDQEPVFKNIGFEIKTGEVLSIIGSSGAGKSTLLRCINQLEHANSGEITFNDGQSFLLNKLNNHEQLNLRQRTSMVFQNYNLFINKTAIENIAEHLITVKKIKKIEALETARQFLEKIELSHLADHYPSQMSGGQQQRIAIARAMAQNSELMLFDEPTSSLDPEKVGEVQHLISEIKGKFTMILVSHEINFVQKISDKVLFLHGGKIEEFGGVEILSHPQSPILKKFLDNH